MQGLPSLCDVGQPGIFNHVCNDNVCAGLCDLLRSLVIAEDKWFICREPGVFDKVSGMIQNCQEMSSHSCVMPLPLLFQHVLINSERCIDHENVSFHYLE